MPKFYTSADARAAGLPFSQSVQIGDVVYLSGCLGNLPGRMELVKGGMEAEARQAMENIGAVLKANGLDYDDVFKCTVMLADMKQWADFNKVYLEYFKGANLPTRSAYGCNGLALNAAVEVEAWAWAGKNSLS